MENPAPFEDDQWWRIEEQSSVGAARRRAAVLATDLGFGPERVGEVSIVVSELATNLVRHAGGGELVVRILRYGGRPRLRLLAIDGGPGSRDIEALIADGASTRGTLGIGLGACLRLSNLFDVYSVPALGTVVHVELAAALDGPPRDGDPAGDESAEAATLTRPLAGAGACGDAAAFWVRSGVMLAMAVDGLGHGPLAADAAQRAVEVFHASDSDSPAVVLERMHAALRTTRGAAIAIVRVDRGSRSLTHAGVGNVAGRLLGGGGTRSLPSQPGIVGHRVPRLRQQSYPVADGSVVVLHSDGLRDRWSPDDVPGVLGHRPAVVGAAIMRSAATRRDDAGVLVIRAGA